MGSLPMPPYMVRVTRTQGRKRLTGLWLPIILLWPLLAALALVAFAVAVPVSLAVRPLGYGRTVLWSVPCLVRLFVAARGLEIERVDGDRETTVRFT
jgi:hypothetical protein